MKFYILGLLKYLKSSLVASFTVLTAFLAPIGDLLMFVSILIVADFITGIIAAKYRGQPRTSAKMFDSAIKFASYMGLIIIGYVFDEYAVNLFKTQLFDHLLSFIFSQENIEQLFKFKLVAAISFIIVVREFKSIDENWYSIRGWSFIDTTIKIFNKIKLVIEYILDLKKIIQK